MREATSEGEKVDVLGPQELFRLDAYWRAANYLSVGQIYLLDNALLRDSLKPEHIKPRLLGHWGTTPGFDRLISIAPKQVDDFVIGHPAEDGWIGDLVTVEMQNGQDGSVRSRIKELVAMPRRGERAGLRLAVAGAASDDQIRVVECGAVSVRKGIAELTAFMNRTRRFGRRVARNSARE